MQLSLAEEGCMPRVFIGLELPNHMKTSLQPCRSGVEGAHWQRDDQLHLTLAFVGEVRTPELAEIASQLSQMVITPFDLRLFGVGFFGKPGQPRALWAGVEDARPLTLLHEKIAHSLTRLGLSVDTRRFVPHVTLARFRRGSQARIGAWLSENERLASSVCTIDHITLFSSHRTDEGSYYRAEESFGAVYSHDMEALWPIAGEDTASDDGASNLNSAYYESGEHYIRAGY